ncbi:MAG: succinylglutamate desuccinylase/aspartoacylase family protein [Pirellulales bacterium]|nr:succinylglutamate desuccinylase/aspartoacylase family protein [Pirellulales bacterium]
MPTLPNLKSVSLHALLLIVFGCAFSATAYAESEWRSAILAGGTPFETPVIYQESGLPGPTVMIVGGVHGNEPAGAAAAQQIADWPITRGTLIVVPRANVPALEINKRLSPDVPKEERDLNRNFKLTRQRIRTLGPIAADLWKVVETHKPDWVIDLHEGFDVNARNKKSVGSSIIHDRSPEADTLTELMLAAVNEEIADAADQFVSLGPPVAGSLARAVADRTPAHGMILETTTKDRRLSLRTRQHRLMVATLLDRLEMLDSTVDGNTLAFGPRMNGKTRVAVYDDDGASANGVVSLLRVCKDSEEIVVRRICAQDVQAGVLDQFDVVCFGGGSGSGLSESLSTQGRSAVRKFIDSGGDYLGVSAGAYLACSGFSWGLEVLDARTKSNKWRRGQATLEVEFEKAGQTFFGVDRRQLDLNYANGPILTPDNKASIPDYQVLAWFREEVSENEAPEGVMINSPAIVHGRFGHGDVYCFSPRPESTVGAEHLLQRVIDAQTVQRTVKQN